MLSLRDLTAHSINRVLSDDAKDALFESRLKELWMPRIVYLGRLFDSMIEEPPSEDDKRFLRVFCQTFPHLVHRCKNQSRKPGIISGDRAYIFANNDAIAPDQPPGMYFIGTETELSLRETQLVLNFLAQEGLRDIGAILVELRRELTSD